MRTSTFPIGISVVPGRAGASVGINPTSESSARLGDTAATMGRVEEGEVRFSYSASTLKRAESLAALLESTGNRSERRETLRNMLSRPDFVAIQQCYEERYSPCLRARVVESLGDSKSVEFLEKLDSVWSDHLGSDVHMYARKSLKLTHAQKIHPYDLLTKSLDLRTSKMKLYAGSSYFHDGLLPAIRQAKTSINIMFNECLGEVYLKALANALKKKIDEGVEVRIMICTFGSNQKPGVKLGNWFLSKPSSEFATFDELIAHGAKVSRVNPTTVSNGLLQFQIMHSKYVGIDGKHFFTGGGTITDGSFASKEFLDKVESGTASLDEYGVPIWDESDTPSTRDLLVDILGGDAVALEESVFYRLWQHYNPIDMKCPGNKPEAIRELFPTLFDESSRDARINLKLINTTPGYGNDAQSEMVSLIRNAKNKVVLAAPYINLKEVMSSLEEAASRGVSVSILVSDSTPLLHDKVYKSAFARDTIKLAKYPNVQIKAYTGCRDKEGQGYIHSKYLLTDFEVEAVEQSEPAKLYITTGNPETTISGTKDGGRSFDISFVTDISVASEFREEVRKMVNEDFSADKSVAFSRNGKPHQKGFTNFFARAILSMVSAS